MLLRPWSDSSGLFLFFFSLCSLFTFVLSGDPSHKIQTFDNLPARLFYFDDSQSAIYFDAIAGDVWVSSDEGMNWKKATDIPSGKALMVIEHPFENQIAFVMTDGDTHYLTRDRGKAWKKFEMPAPMARTPKPLSFHSKNYEYILYQAMVCNGNGWGAVCHDETFYTEDLFVSEPKSLLPYTSRCQFAHSSKDFQHGAPDKLVYCVAFDSTSSSPNSPSIESSKLFSSTDFFETKKVEDLGIGKNARGVVALAIVSKFAVVALKDKGEMMLYVTYDTNTWAQAHFPHASSAKLRENAYTIVESTTHSLGVDVVMKDSGTIGTLFVSNSNGTYFTQSLKDTNRNEMGYVDYEKIYGLEGVGIANIVANPEQVEAGGGGWGVEKLLKSRITWDDGRTWKELQPPQRDSRGNKWSCDMSDANKCSLHLHSVTAPHNFGRIFSSPAPGIVMGVGSVGETLLPYEDCDTFISIDAGVSWSHVRSKPHKYEFGDSGSVLVAVDDADVTNEVSYSLDLGKTWQSYKIGVKLRARALTTIGDSTSQKFVLVGQVGRNDQTSDIGRYVTVFLDFVETRGRKCEERDFEKWYARPRNQECLMGHKQYYKRRKPEADCYVGDKFHDPVAEKEDCECTDDDFECDFNFTPQDGNCVPLGPEPIPAGVCLDLNGKYMGSSGWRKIPGDTCSGGSTKDAKQEKDCKQAKPAEGEIRHQTFEFPDSIDQHAYFKDSQTILVKLRNNAIYQSSNEGYTWKQLYPEERFLGFYHHPHSNERAYLITAENRMYVTTKTGKDWLKIETPTVPNHLGLPVLRFQPESDAIIWTGSICEGGVCHTDAQYSRDNGRKWHPIDTYVNNCAWAVDTKLEADPTEIICESWATKIGRQPDRPGIGLELVEGKRYYQEKRRLFESVVGFAKFSQYLVVAELNSAGTGLELQVSLDGLNFASGVFPQGFRLDTHAYTVLESSTDSLFLHMTMNDRPPYGTILKSNSNGTYFIVSLENVNRNNAGYVDFEKMIGINGIALVNVVKDPQEAAITGKKDLISKITHNDGGTWKLLEPPSLDSFGNKYDCDDARCALHVHGYTERADPRATFSSPSIVGIIMAVGNVGTSLAPYKDCDTFLSRDGGFTWREVHKDAHLWEFGDSGSILIIANDEEPTDHIMFSTDEGLNWREYKFSEGKKIRVRSIVTVPSDTSRRFILLGEYPGERGSVAVQVDFSSLTNKQCVYDEDNPNSDDFELWGPSEDRNEVCLFGQQILYHRRKPDGNCYVGTQQKVPPEVKKTCACTKVDFECEFNHIRDPNTDECVLVPGSFPLPSDQKCQSDGKWYERTAYRKIPHSKCDGGERLDRGKEHYCPGSLSGHGFWFWFLVLAVPFGLTALVGLWWWRNSGLAKGMIRLPGDSRGFRSSGGGVLDTLASVPWFLIGLAGIAYEWVVEKVEHVGWRYRARRGYRNLPVDEDARILRFEDED
ncbi:vacuolar protein sorting/targeting protein PEP1 [Paramarasmius palmivorus]|uniref:Vacuolar protein sorting/targeting protein 10 n=1 Tax=Paramarasmius palmivorus TaxID=297713 RepID=A0AAW0BDP7_9AGAR